MAPRKRSKKRTTANSQEDLRRLIAKLVRDLNKAFGKMQDAADDAQNALEVLGPPPHFGPRCPLKQ